jgi:tRNA U34 2-thiouridine synthase MnmA/TrmU
MKALALLSGGLDSILAVRVIMEQGIEVIGVCFVTPFFGPENARKAAGVLGVKLIEHDFTEEYFAMMKSPRYGFGGNMNPCIDCHGLMLKTAHSLLEKFDASFLITGEVLGERPMSQTRGGLNAVLKLSADRDLVLRPLSAKLLEPTKPEREGWADREKLHDFSGRGRKRQEELAQSFGIKDYPQPAGGCLLTEEKYSQRLKELIEHEGLNRQDAELLSLGRHFRLEENTKMVVGRNRSENQRLLDLAGSQDTVIRPAENIKGPVGIIKGEISEDILQTAGKILARYCDRQEGQAVGIDSYRNKEKEGITVMKPHEAFVLKWQI